MPKLIVNVDLKLTAGPMKSTNAEHSTEILSASELKKMILGCDQDDFSLSVAFLDLEEGWPTVGFEVNKKFLKKGGTFEFSIDEDSCLASITAKGELSSAAVRAGVVPVIQQMGEKADLRLTAFNFKGGKWSGFTASITGQKEDDFKNWIQIKDWKLK